MFRLFAICVIIAFVHAYNLNAQNQNQKNTGANINAQSQPTFKDQRENEIKLNEQIVELKKQIAELTQKVGDNKQVFYDSIFNVWGLLLTVIGIILVIITIKGAKNLSEKIAELKTDNKDATDRSERNISEVKIDLNQRITELNEKIREFKDDQKENFTRFEKESKEKIDKGLSSDLQRAIEKIMNDSFASQLNENSEQISELRNKVENLLSQQIKTEPITQAVATKPEVNQFDGNSEKQPSGEKNAFDE